MKIKITKDHYRWLVWIGLLVLLFSLGSIDYHIKHTEAFVAIICLLGYLQVLAFRLVYKR